ncbi:MAG: ABC transporter permease, partial [Minisyncoccia bacterium]
SALGTGGFIGLINGIIIGYGEIPPIITTLGMMNIIRALIFQVLGGRWITEIPENLRIIGIGRFLEIPISIWIAIGLIIFFSYFLRSRPLGRYIYAVGNNEEAARVSGINSRVIRLLVYAIGGILAGFSGVLYATRTGIVQTNTGMGFELDVIAAVVLGGTSIRGGKGTIVGSLLGAILVGIIKNGMVLLNVPALTEGLIIGLLIIGSVIIDLIKTQGG